MVSTLVSIVVPSFNQGKYIGETIQSIVAQDYRPIEILVVDGGSTDETLDVLKSFDHVPELSWVSEPDRGVVDAVNKGLRRCRGEFSAVQSSDDIYTEGALSAVIEVFESQPDVALVYGNVLRINADSSLWGVDAPDNFDLDRLLGRFLYIPQPSAFFRTAVGRKVGGWREEVSYVADMDFWIRIALDHKVKKMDRVLGGYRSHPQQRDTQRAKIARDWEEMVRLLLDSGRLRPRSRRFARMSVHLARHKYGVDGPGIRRSWHVYRAALANPAAVADRNFPVSALLLGRFPRVTRAVTAWTSRNS